MKTALVTGAAGFTGRHTTVALRERGYKVIGIAERRTQGTDLIACDLTNASATKLAVRRAKPDLVVHLAAVSFVGHDDPFAFYRVNLFATLNLLVALAALEVAPSKVLIASSATVYGIPALESINESVCPAPVNHYATSKLAMEHMVRTWFDRLPIVITRPFNYTGPGQSDQFLVPKIVEHFRRRAPVIELGNLEVSRDFSDVEEVVAAYILLLESSARSEIVNVCSGRAIPLREVLSMMCSLAGYQIEVRVKPELVRQNEILRLVGDNTKLKNLVRFAPSRPFLETLQRMYAARPRSLSS
jgi:nucleoside-diphosphate-sugar epimerase